MRANKAFKQGIQKNCVQEFQIISTLELPSCGLVVFMDMNTYILTENRNFKTFLKKNYAVDWESFYVFTKTMLNMELNIMLRELIEFAYIRHS